MAQGYYTLEEAAQILNTSVDELKMLARHGEVRSFQDRGTWRFRVADIQELARKRGLTSDPELSVGDPAPPTFPEHSPFDEDEIPLDGDAMAEDKNAGSTNGGAPDQTDAEVFPFSLGSDDTSDEMIAFQDGAENNMRPDSIPDDSSALDFGEESPEEKPGSDSDVRLVPSDDQFVGSDVRLGDTPANRSPGELTTASGTGLSGPISGPIDQAESATPDSGVRLVSMDSDSDVRITETDEYQSFEDSSDGSSSDSDVRLEQNDASSGDASEGLVTEELEAPSLDSETPETPTPKAPLPAGSPFELETDLGLPSTGSSAEESDSDSGSSEFELSLPADMMEDDDDAVDLGASPPKKSGSSGPKSGISLSNPMDSGISLEQESEGSDEFSLGSSSTEDGDHQNSLGATEHDASSSEFELTLDSEDAPDAESSSEFELTLDIDDSIGGSGMEDESSSEFELTLDMDDSSADSPALDLSEPESSSEFELTIDTDDEAADGANLDSPESEFELSLDDSEISDISDSEFELALDDSEFPESGSEVAALDDDGIDFDLEEESASEVVALDEDADMDDSFDIEEESGSAVVALDEDEDYDEADETLRGGLEEIEIDEDYADVVDDDEAGLFAEIEDDEAAPAGKTVVVEKPIEAAPWGPLPTIFMLPCVAVLVVVGLLGYELVQSSVSGNYQEPGMLTKAIGGLFGMKF